MITQRNLALQQAYYSSSMTEHIKMNYWNNILRFVSKDFKNALSLVLFSKVHCQPKLMSDPWREPVGSDILLKWKLDAFFPTLLLLCFLGACVPKSTLNGFYPLNFANNITITKQNYLAGTCYTNTKILFLCRELLRILRCRLLRQRQKVFYEFLRTFHQRKTFICQWTLPYEFRDMALWLMEKLFLRTLL